MEDKESSSSAAMVDAPQQTSPFLSLPPEIRHLIYDHAVNPVHEYFSLYDLPFIRACRLSPSSERHKFLIGSDDDDDIGLTLPDPDGLHSLILLNRQIHSEMMDWFPRSREIRCNELNSFAQLLLAREESGSAALRDMRKLSLVINRVAQTLVFHPNEDVDQVAASDGEGEKEEKEEDLEISRDSLRLLKKFTKEEITGWKPEGLTINDVRGFGWDLNTFTIYREGFERHFHYYGRSYSGFRERVRGLRLREFTVTVLCSEVLEVDGVGFMDVLSADARGLIGALPVGLGEGGVWRVVVHGFKGMGEAEDGREMVCESFYSAFERRGDRLVEEDDEDEGDTILLSDVGMEVNGGDEGGKDGGQEESEGNSHDA